MNSKFIFWGLLFFSNFSANAGFNGSLSFSQIQITTHLENISQLTSEASLCLKEHLNYEEKFFGQYGISPYFGENSDYSKMTNKERVSFLKSKQLDAKIIDQLKGISCVGLVLKCLESGFRVTQQENTYQIIYKFISANDLDGSALQFALSKLGWKTFYWNPKPSQNKLWDFEEKVLNFTNNKNFRGFHFENYQTILTKKKYFMNEVDDITTLVNFGKNEPDYLKSMPFFIGTAHMGYHVFSGSYGTVIEGHSGRSISDKNTIESAPFNPLSSDGAPSGKYRSGIISIPPSLN